MNLAWTYWIDEDADLRFGFDWYKHKNPEGKYSAFSLIFVFNKKRFDLIFISNTKRYLETNYWHVDDMFLEDGALFWKPFAEFKSAKLAEKTKLLDQPKSGLIDAALASNTSFSGGWSKLEPSYDSKKNHVAGKVKNKRKRAKGKNVKQSKKLSNRPKRK